MWTCRLLGLGLSRITRNRHVRVDISEIGLLVTKGIHVHLAKVSARHDERLFLHSDLSIVNTSLMH